MKHAKTSTPRDIVVDMLIAMGARSDQFGRHRAAVPGDGWVPSSKLAQREVLVPQPRHRAEAS